MWANLSCEQIERAKALDSLHSNYWFRRTDAGWKSSSLPVTCGALMAEDLHHVPTLQPSLLNKLFSVELVALILSLLYSFSFQNHFCFEWKCFLVCQTIIVCGCECCYITFRTFPDWNKCLFVIVPPFNHNSISAFTSLNKQGAKKKKQQKAWDNTASCQRVTYRKSSG